MALSIVPRYDVPLAPPRRALTRMYTPQGWVVHYVGGSNMSANITLDQAKALWRSLQQDAFANASEGYIDIQYNFAVSPDGHILEGRGWDFQSGANGSSTYNEHAWAVCYLGGVGTPVTSAAKAALTALTQEGARRAPQISYVKGHRDVYGTACPGNELYAFVPSLVASLHRSSLPPATWKVSPTYNPPLDLNDVVDSLEIPDRGAWVLTLAGKVYAMGRGIVPPPLGGPYGHGYWAGRTAAKLKPRVGGGYTVIATSGERYDFASH